MAKQVQKKQEQGTDSGLKYKLLISFPVIIIALIFSTKAVDLVLLPKFICYAAFAILISVIACVYTLKNPQSFNVIKESLFFKLYLAYIAISFVSVFISCNFGEAIFEWLKLVLFGSCIWSVSVYFYNNKKFIEHFINAINLLNAIIVIIGLVQFVILFSRHDVTHTASYEVTATFGHKNIFAEILFLTFPFTLFNLFTQQGKWKWLSGTSAFLTLFLITLTLTRAVWLATVAGFLISFPVYFYALLKGKNLKTQFKHYRKNILIVVVLLMAILASILVYSRIDSFNTIKMQTITISSFKYGSVGERIQLWKKSLKVFAESPLLGKGLGSWRIEVLKYGHQGLETENNITFHQRPHNDFIWIAAEQGLSGLLAYISIVLFVLISLVKLILKSETANEKLAYFLALYAYTGYLLYSCLSFPKERIEHQIIFVFLIAIIIIKSGKQKSLQQKGSSVYLVFIPLIVLSCYALKIGLTRYQAETHLQKAYQARNNAAWQNTIDEINKAESMYYNIDPMCTPLRWYSGSAYYNLGYQDLAFADFYKAYEINPNHVHVLNNLATAYELKSDHNHAIAFYKKALLISPNFEEARVNLCATYFNAGNKQASFQEFELLKTDTANEKYRQMINLIVRPEVLRLSDSISNEPLKKMVEAIYNVPDWSQQIFLKAAYNGINFKKQLIDDAVYTMDSLEKKNNFAYIFAIQKKYTRKKSTNTIQ